MPYKCKWLEWIVFIWQMWMTLMEWWCYHSHDDSSVSPSSLPQSATNINWPGLKPTTILLRTTPTRTINHPHTLTHLGYNQQQSFSGLHQPGRSTKSTHIDSLGSQPTTVLLRTTPTRDDQPSTNIDSPGTQPTTVLLRTTPTRTINQPQTLTHLGHSQRQSFSGLHQPGRSTNHKHWLTWVTTINSPSQDYTNPDYQPTTNIDSPGFRPFTVLYSRSVCGSVFVTGQTFRSCTATGINSFRKDS